MYYQHILADARDKFTRFAQEVFGKETAEEGLDALTALIQDCGLSVKLGQLKSKTEITPDLLLVGYTDTAYLFHDPLQGGAIAYEKNQVLAAYRAMGEMALVMERADGITNQSR